MKFGQLSSAISDSVLGDSPVAEDVVTPTDIGEVEILLVEDSPDDTEMCLRALRKQGFANKVHHVEDGEEALDFLFGSAGVQRPKVVLLDLKLPKLCGIEVLRRMRADKRTRSIPVVIMTSSSEHSDLEECYRLGANSYVVKPVVFQDFARAVSEIGLYWLLINRLPY